MDQDAGNAGKQRCIAQELIVFQEGGVSPVMRHQASEPETELRVVKARVALMSGDERDVRVFPRAPRSGGALLDVGIRIEQQGCIGVNQRRVPQPLGHG